jgi:hypothetical protein
VDKWPAGPAVECAEARSQMCGTDVVIELVIGLDIRLDIWRERGLGRDWDKREDRGEDRGLDIRLDRRGDSGLVRTLDRRLDTGLVTSLVFCSDSGLDAGLVLSFDRRSDLRVDTGLDIRGGTPGRSHGTHYAWSVSSFARPGDRS